MSRILPISMALSQVALSARRQISCVAARAVAQTRYLVGRAENELAYVEWMQRRYQTPPCRSGKGERIDLFG